MTLLDPSASSAPGRMAEATTLTSSRRACLLGMAGLGMATLAGPAVARPLTQPEAPPFFAGVNFGYLAKQGYYGSVEGRAQIDAIADAGVPWVSLIVMLMQDTFYSTRVYRDAVYTAGDAELTEAIRAFQARGVKVLLKPMIDCHDSAWRGRITFPDGDQQIQGVVTDYWGPWFRSMTANIVYYARLAEALGVEAFTVVQELVGTERQTARWLDTIAQVRDVYSGLICVNADRSSDMLSDYMLPWLRQTDAVGMSFYPAIPGPDRPDLETIKTALIPYKDRLRELSAGLGKPIYFAEFGCRSVVGGARATNEYQNVGDYDGQVQADFLEGLFQTFWNEPSWGGYQYWKWDEQQIRPHYAQAGGDTGFTLQGKPAEAVMRRWSRTPRRVAA